MAPVLSPAPSLSLDSLQATATLPSPIPDDFVRGAGDSYSSEASGGPAADMVMEEREAEAGVPCLSGPSTGEGSRSGDRRAGGGGSSSSSGPGDDMQEDSGPTLWGRLRAGLGWCAPAAQ